MSLQRKNTSLKKKKVSMMSTWRIKGRVEWIEVTK